MKLRNFIITIRGGQPHFTSKYAQGLFNEFLKQFEGKRVWLTIDPKEPKRSEQQNRYYWLYVEMIARETGYTPEELHSLFKGKFLTSGISEVFGEKVRRTKSTTDLKKSEFVEYIMQIEEFTGIKSPDATPYSLNTAILNNENAKEEK